MDNSKNSDGTLTESKDALSILIQLVNIAQKRGAFDIQESYLAFCALSKFVDDPKIKTAEEIGKKLFASNLLDKEIQTN